MKLATIKNMKMFIQLIFSIHVKTHWWVCCALVQLKQPSRA